LKTSTMLEDQPGTTEPANPKERDALSPTGRVFSQQLCLKLDLHIMAPFALLNFLSLMGRTNIGAALIQKLPQDLRLGAMDVFLCVAIPNVALMLWELPSNLLMRWLESRWGLSYMKYLSTNTILLG